jgi:hypothetical protein
MFVAISDAPGGSEGRDIFSIGGHFVFGWRVGPRLGESGFLLWFNDLGGRGEVGPDPALWVGTTWRRSGGKLRGERYGIRRAVIAKAVVAFLFERTGSGT